MGNTWPGGKRKALNQSEHEEWNKTNYPGTLQLCDICDSPTGRCEEDTLWDENDNVLCEDCYKRKGCQFNE